MSNTENDIGGKATKIAFTTGEPAGVGPDLALSLISHQREEIIVVFADPEVISARALALGQQIKILEIRDISHLTSGHLRFSLPHEDFVRTFDADIVEPPF